MRNLATSLFDDCDLQVHIFRSGAVGPSRSTDSATGWDLWACLDEPVIIEPGQTKVINLGFNVSFSTRWDVQIRSRSGLAAKGIVVANSPGTIDPDYSGLGPDYEVKVILHNQGQTPFTVESGMRVAQMVVQERLHEPWFMLVSADTFKVRTQNRSGGLGSTGVK